MDADEFRILALSLPEAVESAHMGHPDFRVGAKIFATLWTDGKTGVVMLEPEQQAELVRTAPKVFEPVKGAWGRKGATQVCLAAATQVRVRRALVAAWRNKAPEGLSDRIEDP